jgi:hypothetical protein
MKWVDKFPPSEGNIVAEYIYHCNSKKPTGEDAFTALSIPIGWAKDPIIERLQALDPKVPVKFLYGQVMLIDLFFGFFFFFFDSFDLFFFGFLSFFSSGHGWIRMQGEHCKQL